MTSCKLTTNKIIDLRRELKRRDMTVEELVKERLAVASTLKPKVWNRETELGITNKFHEAMHGDLKDIEISDPTEFADGAGGITAKPVSYMSSVHVDRSKAEPVELMTAEDEEEQDVDELTFNEAMTLAESGKTITDYDAKRIAEAIQREEEGI